MIVDGKKIAADILAELKSTLRAEKLRPHLTVFTCAPNFETQRFLTIKKKRATEVGIDINVIELLDIVTTEDVIASIRGFVDHTNGIVVQLPFPKHIDIEQVIEAIPTSHDADALKKETKILPPVVGAIAEIFARHGVVVMGKKIVVVGGGKLVGAPAANWCTERGGDVTVVTEAESKNLSEHTKDADILILGAGKPGLITPEHIKESVIIADAGTSEEAGELRGDADSACAQKAALFTPVPGGIGPVTIAVLLRNLVELTRSGV